MCVCVFLHLRTGTPLHAFRRVNGEINTRNSQGTGGRVARAFSRLARAVAEFSGAAEFVDGDGSATGKTAVALAAARAPAAPAAPGKQNGAGGSWGVVEKQGALGLFKETLGTYAPAFAGNNQEVGTHLLLASIGSSSAMHVAYQR